MIRTRLAPSPTGDPHIGTLFQALFDYVFAKANKGKFIVRIEDTDQNRLVEGAQEALFKSLDWLGLTPDESVIHGGKYGPYKQSERLDIYQKYAKQLVEAGHAYPCFCSSERLDQVRKDKQKNGLPPMYDKKCRDLDSKEATKKAITTSHVIRMKVPQDQTIIVDDLIRGQIKFDSNIVDDQIILKSDGFPTYHLAVVVDDHLMKITHMVRGEEWISSAPKHVLLYQYFDWQSPKFIHTPLLRNPDRSKLSKRHGHASVDWYIKTGYLKEAVINFLATRVWNHPKGLEIFDIKELINNFKFKDLHIQGPIADIDKLNWINGQWIRKLSQPEILSRLKSFKSKDLPDSLLKEIWPLIKERIEKLSDLKDLTDYFVHPPKLNLRAILKESKMSPQDTADYLKKVHTTINSLSAWSVESLEESLHQLQKDLRLKPRPAFMTLRLSLTGRSATPPLFDTIYLIGKTKTIDRLEHAQKICLS